jgi:hypothetical protein
MAGSISTTFFVHKLVVADNAWKVEEFSFGRDLCGFGSLPVTVRAVPVEVHSGEIREIQPLTVTLESRDRL